jgi:putative transposase
VQYIKGKSSYKLMQENKQISKAFWGRHLWGRGYFVSTSGNVTDEVIMKYIKNQDRDNKDENFTVNESWSILQLASAENKPFGFSRR